MGDGQRGEAEARRELSRRLREARKATGLSQEQLAHTAGLHRTYVGHMEQGKVNPTMWSMVRVADGLGIDPGTLIAGLRPLPDAPDAR